MSMKEFEAEAEKIDSEFMTDDTNSENVIEWIRNSNTVTVSLTQKKYITKIKKLAETHPDEVEICTTNNDGSIVAHLPLKYIAIRAPKHVEISEERKEQMAMILKQAREKKKS